MLVFIILSLNICGLCMIISICYSCHRCVNNINGDICFFSVLISFGCVHVYVIVKTM
jgi:hypothetical protein